MSVRTYSERVGSTTDACKHPAVAHQLAAEIAKQDEWTFRAAEDVVSFVALGPVKEIMLDRDGGEWTSDEAWDEANWALDSLPVRVTRSGCVLACEVEWDMRTGEWYIVCDEEPDAWVCSDCAMAIANNDLSGAEDPEHIAKSVERFGNCCLMSDCGDESSVVTFSHSECDCCGGLPGQRYAVTMLD